MIEPVSLSDQAARIAAVLPYLKNFQQKVCASFGNATLGGHFVQDVWQKTPGESTLQGNGITAVQENGAIFERAGVAFSDVQGPALPPAATARNPRLAGKPFRAMGVSVVMHPRNPHAPTSHLNVRFLSAGEVWWFGGGFDLTPYIPYEADFRDWHHAARAACEPAQPDFYTRARQHCDEYFYLKHRSEARGIGGIFYDDINPQHPDTPLDFPAAFALLQRVATAYHDSYLTIVQRRHALASTDRQRRYQLYRRGRYVEFNLVLDRGTHFGLQSGGRTESILMSMPPLAAWQYGSSDAEMDAALLPYLTTLRGKNWFA